MKNSAQDQIDISQIAAAIVLIGCTGIASAQSESKSPVDKGDVIHLDVKLDFEKRSKVTDSNVEKVCFLPETGLDVVDVEADKIVFKRRNRTTLTVAGEERLLTNCLGGKFPKPEADENVYAIGIEALKRNYYRHFGWTHGALFVPFKRRSDHTLSGESNLGYYLGYRFGAPMGWRITPVASVGMSIVNVDSDSSTNASSTLQDSGNRAAFTASAGFILVHLDSFQVGIFAGQDRIGGAAGDNWKYEGRWWTSVGFGYSFAR